MAIKIREFNEVGIEKFREYITSLKETGNSGRSLEDLLSDETYTRILSTKIEIEQKNFPTKFDIAEYLHGKISGISPDKRV